MNGEIFVEVGHYLSWRCYSGVRTGRQDNYKARKDK
jgi:hypothetical protein